MLNFSTTIELKDDPLSIMTVEVETKDEFISLSQYNGDGTDIVALHRDQAIRLRTVISEWLDR